MLAIKKARKLIEADPQVANAVTLTNLVLALQNDHPFQLGKLYELEPKDFDLAVEIMREWTLDRHYAKKTRLIDVVVKLAEERTQAD